MKKIEVKNLTCIYQHKHEQVIAVNNFSFALNYGEILVIFGPSGCGKSTLLKTIAGLKVPRSGQIFINGIDLNDLHIKTLNFSFVFQQNNLYSFASIYNNIAMPLKAQKIAIDEIERRVLTVSEYFNITHLLSRKPKHLSGGQIQLVTLAKAMIKQPDYYLFDEPFANLDLRIRHEMRKEVKRINKAYNTAMIFVTHDVNEAYELGNRIIMMDKGRFVEELTPDKFMEKHLHELNKMAEKEHE